jgi:hypothetical protein
MTKPLVFILQVVGAFLILFGAVQFKDGTDGDMLAIGIVIFLISIAGRVMRRKKS